MHKCDRVRAGDEENVTSGSGLEQSTQPHIRFSHTLSHYTHRRQVGHGCLVDV